MRRSKLFGNTPKTSSVGQPVSTPKRISTTVNRRRITTGPLVVHRRKF